MNDTIIIIICIFFIILTWVVYFKLLIKEGNDPNVANYTMPISFSGEGDNKTINIPPIVTSNNGRLNLNATTTINANTTINGIENVTGLSTLKDATVTGSTNLNVATVNGLTTLNNATVNGTSTLKDTVVNGTATLNGITNTTSINVGNTQKIIGFQAGSSLASSYNFFVKFPVQFPEGQVTVVTTPSGTNGWEWNLMTNVMSTNKTGFYVTVTGISGGGTWEPTNVTINWIAYCYG